MSFGFDTKIYTMIIFYILIVIKNSMYKKNNVLLVIIFMSLFSCGQNNSKKKTNAGMKIDMNKSELQILKENIKEEISMDKRYLN